MNTLNFNSKKEKMKHLNLEHYEYIQSHYNHFLFSTNKSKSKTAFMKSLAVEINTTLSNLYNIVHDGMIRILNTDLTTRLEFSANAAFNKRSKKSKESNALKLHIAQPFIDLVIEEYLDSNSMNSIDEIINNLKCNQADEIKGMETICTATFYNYIEDNRLELKASQLPLKLLRKPKKKHKVGKRQKGVSIEKRPDEVDSRETFGHWEGDTIVGGSSIKNSGAILTLVERKTRFQIAVPLKDRTSKSVRLAFNKIEKMYSINIRQVFKTVTFDNGVEFSCYRELEKKWKFSTFFAHPYSSWERGSNENCNRLLRRFIPKSTNINGFSKKYIQHANTMINEKTRKINGYKSSLQLFNIELENLA